MNNSGTQEQMPKTPQWRRGVMRPLSCPTEDSPTDTLPLWEQGHHNMIPASLDECVPSTCLVLLYVCVCVCVYVLGTGSCLLVADVCDCDCVCGCGHVIVVCGSTMMRAHIGCDARRRGVVVRARCSQCWLTMLDKGATHIHTHTYAHRCTQPQFTTDPRAPPLSHTHTPPP